MILVEHSFSALEANPALAPHIDMKNAEVRIRITDVPVTQTQVVSSICANIKRKRKTLLVTPS